MKLQKRIFLYIFIFVIALFLMYLLVTTFFYNTLNFKTFYQFHKTSQISNEYNIQYLLNDQNEIVYVYKDKETIKINKILDNDVDPKTLLTFSLDEEDTIQSFRQVGNYYYLMHQQNQSLIKMDLENKNYQEYNLPEGKFIINPYNNEFYLYDAYQLYELSYHNNQFDRQLKYDFHSQMKEVKNVEFLKENQLVFTTYEGIIYTYDCVANQLTSLKNLYQEYIIAEDKLYYTSYKNSDKMMISVYDGISEKSFEIDKVDYLKIQVKGDFLYLIDQKQMYKVSISREKKQEKMILSEYQDMTYDLTNVLIVNEKLMYLPMEKATWNYTTEKDDYDYYLYRYKIK